MKNKIIFVSIPFELLKDKYLPLVLKEKLNVEITLKAEILDNFSRRDFKEIAEKLKEAGLKTTIHLPYMDLSLGALDAWIRDTSIKRIIFAIERAIVFDPINLVLHSGYHPQGHREVKLFWRDKLIEGLGKILTVVKDLKLNLALENTFEPDPEFMKPIFENIKDLGWCFDPSHAKVFSEEKNELKWLYTLFPYIKEIHCHDNHGEWDEHLAIGKGIIRFEEIFDFLKKNALSPILTSEAHTEEDTILNLNYLNKL